MKSALRDMASVIRSKNSGPYELTFDVLFKDDKTYRLVTESRAINKRLIADLYSIPEETVLSIINFPRARAVKATIVRPIPSGSQGERDVYGSQQHAPLLSAVIEVKE